MKVPLPGWLALMEHCPTATRTTVVELTVQTSGVCVLKVTGRPEVAMAETVSDPALMVRSARPVKVMVWFAWLTVNDWITGGAATKLALPDWLAVIEHCPAMRSVTVELLTVQTERVFEAKATGRVEVAVAEMVRVPTLRSWPLSGAQLMVSLPAELVSEKLAGVLIPGTVTVTA